MLEMELERERRRSSFVLVEGPSFAEKIVATTKIPIAIIPKAKKIVRFTSLMHIEVCELSELDDLMVIIFFIPSGMKHIHQRNHILVLSCESRLEWSWEDSVVENGCSSIGLEVRFIPKRPIRPYDFLPVFIFCAKSIVGCGRCCGPRIIFFFKEMLKRPTA